MKTILKRTLLLISIALASIFIPYLLGTLIDYYYFPHDINPFIGERWCEGCIIILLIIAIFICMKLMYEFIRYGEFK